MKSEEIIKKIIQVVGESSKSKPISLHEPSLKDTNSLEYLKDCIDSGWVSSNGKWVNEFERRICDFTGAKHAVAVVNCTSGLRLALHVTGVKQFEEVLMPPLTFVASANAVSHLKAIPHFVDIEKERLGICPSKLKKRLENIAIKKNGEVINKQTKRKISAILPVHVFGKAAKVNEIKSIADQWGLKLIEDAAESLGSWDINNNKCIHCGLIGDIGVLSFNGNKIITTGGGGALITNNDTLAKKARHLSTTAKVPHAWDFIHDEIGWNDRMPNINAALGCAELEKIKNKIENKNLLLKKYQKIFEDSNDVEILGDPNDLKTNNWLITLRFKNSNPYEAAEARLELLKNAHKIGLLIRPNWNLLHHLEIYKDCPKDDLKNAEIENSRLVNLPSSPQLLKTRN